jgi:hypothetical protein
MNKLLLTTLYALTLVGCNDGKQQKLEDCMAQAAFKFKYVREGMSSELGCAKPDAPVAACENMNARAKRDRLEDEDRCVKLYK